MNEAKQLSILLFDEKVANCKLRVLQSCACDKRFGSNSILPREICSWHLRSLI